MDRVQFADRGMSMSPRVNLTMAMYSEPPMIPKNGDNEFRRDVIKKALMVIPKTTPEQRARIPHPKKIDKRIGKLPAKPINMQQLSEEQKRRQKEAISMAALAKSEAKARAIFANGPLTSDKAQEAFGYKQQRFVTRHLRELSKRGIIKKIGMVNKTALWGIA